ncbi:hypothetical protein HGRIS_007862 [Hohenbuehelia grisea]|uniref:Protein kinase domain-containing protein n=1 Tax=Hohenbuehelia grisea TaxID=104357 RepID=A0ABR3J649_9AGAR
MPRAAKPAKSEADILIDQYLPNLTGTVAYRVLSVLKDGRKHSLPSCFHVSAKLPGGIGPSRGKGAVQCFLKVFPDDSKGKLRYMTDRIANAKLAQYDEHVACSSVSAATQGDPKRASPWPKCFGRLVILDDIVVATDKFPIASQRALLFEFIPSLRLLSKEDLDNEMCTSILSDVALVHSAGLVHRDLKERTLEPTVGFRNIFLVTDPEEAT